MVKKFKNIIGVCVVFLCISCNKQLDLPLDGRITMEEVFSDYNRTRGYLNSCYGYAVSPILSRSSFTDEAQDSEVIISGNQFLNWYNGNVTSSNFGSVSPDGSPWGQLYQGIRKCNVFIENIPTSTAFASETTKAGWKAQAHALRALYYLQLVKRYGSVPLIDKELPVGSDYTSIRKASVAEILQFIIQDCREALAAPNEQDGFSWNIYDNQFRMMTRGVPYAIISQAITYASSPLFSDGSITAESATAINAEALGALLANDYKLFDVQPTAGNAENSYALYFLTNPDDQRSVDKETIYGLGGRQEVWRYAGLPSTANQERAGHCPTQGLVDAYEMANGQSPILGYQDADKLLPNINTASGYDPNNPYVGRDPRFYASIFFNGASKTSREQGYEEYPITLQLGTANQMVIKEENGYYDIATTGGDPFIQTSPLTADLKLFPSITLEFEYQSTTGINRPELFFSPIAGGRSTTYPNIPAAADWTKHTIDISASVARLNWGKSGNNLRFDVGVDGNRSIRIRNIKLIEQSVASSNLVETFVGGNDQISNNSRKNTRTGYYLKKYFSHSSNLNSVADGFMRLFRLAEIYLNFAESAYQSHGPDVKIAVGNQMMSARDAVNFVRARAGMPEIPAGLSKEQFELRYRNERRIEFAFEDHRYFDVRRWKILEQTDRFVTGMRIEKVGNNFTYTRFKFENRNAWEDKFLLYPINKSEVDKVLRLTGENWQNPGWLE
ncbi:RagB/SusD family nutrient uptake outer membrane protein [Sphingobacterium hungaricum]|uniref:RagB/SusD family nutrient uptake outer membrane protein n=1 Tax=Sphingobacterium hungaricum TaxID=2082723 RepID=A0A928UZ48_9SPHI|nr:RagB/SusD family nutrient uptake outer membrane protein [Sphingobacterium hungaricum]MBE8713724.1 RagB/SusD family nutrient uptake outer membrane protein [Sphingobacterium hungaricum]